MVSRSVVPSRTSSRTTDQISLRLRGSSPVVGSSKNSTRGRVSRLDARSRRRRIPPEYVRAGRSAASASSKRSSSTPARRRASAAERSNRRPNIWRFSRPVSISSTAANWPVSPNSSRTPAASWTTSRPNTSARPGVRSEQRGQHPDKRRLPRAVRSQQPKDRALLDIQVDPSKRRRRPEALDHTLDMNSRIRHHSRSSPVVVVIVAR